MLSKSLKLTDDYGINFETAVACILSLNFSRCRRQFRLGFGEHNKTSLLFLVNIKHTKYIEVGDTIKLELQEYTQLI